MLKQPRPERVNPDELVDLALAVIEADRFPRLATSDGDQARVRPVSPVKTNGFEIFVANLRHYHKTQELAANPRLELCYVDGNHDQVRITGVAEIVRDDDELQEIWDTNPLLRSYLGKIDNPDLIIYRIRPVRVRFMREWALDYHDVPLLRTTS